jgi:pyruvate/2-oxoglutarate dehydrogenase complex dihydrolipoamide dehydrogenase (E3) component
MWMALDSGLFARHGLAVDDIPSMAVSTAYAALLSDEAQVVVGSPSSFLPAVASGADFVVVATGSRPRVPDFVPVDHERVLTTRDSYPPPEMPEHMIVIGSGVTGVEFTHLFDSLGSKVTLLVSRQQVLPIKDPEVAAVLEEAFLARGVTLLKGARANGIHRDGNVVRVECEDGRVIEGSHALLRSRLVENLSVQRAMCSTTCRRS